MCCYFCYKRCCLCDGLKKKRNIRHIFFLPVQIQLIPGSVQGGDRWWNVLQLLRRYVHYFYL